jgi:hypothetical protein
MECFTPGVWNACGEAAGYTLEEGPFAGPSFLVMAIFMVYKSKQMRKMFAFVAAAMLHSASAQEPVLNGGFEEWVDGEPEGWTTNNNIITGSPVTAADPGYSGTFALRGEVVGSMGQNYGPLVTSLDADGQPHAVDGNYSMLTFRYRLGLSGPGAPEVFSTSILFSDGMNTTAAGTFQLTHVANSQEWTLAEVPIVQLGGSATRMTITFMLGGTGSVAGSFFEIDDLMLVGATAVTEMEHVIDMGAPFPVPAHTEVQLPIQLDRSAEVDLVVLDAQGRVMLERLMGTLAPGRHTERVDVAGWAAGSYTFLLLGTDFRSGRSVLVAP